MHFYSTRDLIGGGLLVLAGLLVAVTATLNYDLGTFSEMGSGMLPAILGWMLVGLGALIALPAWLGHAREEDDDAPQIEMRPALAVIGAIVAFAITIDLFGMIPAVIVLTVVGALADNKIGPLGLLVLSAVLAAIAVAIFHFGLGIQIPILLWPF